MDFKSIDNENGPNLPIWLRRRNTIFVGSLVFLASIVGIYAIYASVLKPGPDDVSETSEVTFEGIIEQGSPDQLADLFERTQEDPTASLPERISVLKQKQKTAQQLLQANSKKHAVLAKSASFEHLAKINSLLLFYGLLDNEGEAVVEQYFDDLADIDSLALESNTEEKVVLSRLLAETFGLYLEAWIKNQELSDAFKQQYAETVSKCIYRENLLRVLFDVGMHAFNKKTTDELLKTFIAIPPETLIGKQLVDLGAKIVATSSLASPATGGVEEFVPSNADTTFEKVRASIQATTVAAELAQQLSVINQFASVGRPKLGNQLLEIARPKVEISKSSLLTDKFKKIKKRLDGFGKPFSLAGVTTLDDQPAVFNDRSKRKIILVGSTTSRSETEPLFTEFARMSRVTFSGIGGDEKFETIFLIHDVEGKALGLKKLMDASRRLPMIKFWKVSETTESGKAFLNQMPLDDVPFFIILDQNSHPESIGADSTLLRLLVSESPSANQ